MSAPHRALLDAAFTGFQALFTDGWENSRTYYQDYVWEVASSTAKEQWHFPSSIPGMREWTSERVEHELDRHSTELANVDYELTIGINRNDFEDDRLGIYAPMIRNLGARAKQHPDALFASLLNNGFTGICYDGKPFFAANHTRARNSSASKVNKLTGASSALDADSLDAAVALLEGMTDDDNEPLNLIDGPDGDEGPAYTLWVPPALRATAEELVRVRTLSGGGDNRHYNRAGLVVSPRLTSATAWFLLPKRSMLKPFIYQSRSKAQFVRKDQPNDDNAFWNRRFIYGVEGRWAMGYGPWQAAIGSEGA